MNWDKILKILILLCLFLFLITYIFYGKSDCEKCRFEIEGEELRANQFMEIYSEECFEAEIDFWELNFSGRLNNGQRKITT